MAWLFKTNDVQYKTFSHLFSATQKMQVFVSFRHRKLNELNKFVKSFSTHKSSELDLRVLGDSTNN